MLHRLAQDALDRQLRSNVSRNCVLHSTPGMHVPFCALACQDWSFTFSIRSYSEPQMGPALGSKPYSRLCSQAPIRVTPDSSIIYTVSSLKSPKQGLTLWRQLLCDSKFLASNTRHFPFTKRFRQTSLASS